MLVALINLGIEIYQAVRRLGPDAGMAAWRLAATTDQMSSK
jgi:hypothetical protein